MNDKNKKSLTIALAVLAIVLVSTLAVYIFNQRSIFSSSLKEETISNSLKPGELNSTSSSVDSTSTSESASTSKNESTQSTNNNSTQSASQSNTQNNNQSTQTTNSQPASTPTQAELNNQKRNNIQNTYGVSVQYGNEFSSWYGSVTDDSKINSMLDDLNSALSNFPNGFFRELGASHLTYRFVAYAEENNQAGLTDHEYFSNVYIYISSMDSYYVKRVTYHETMHYIDNYLYGYYGYSPEDQYNALNPQGFVYGNFNGAYAFLDKDSNCGNYCYFSDLYGETNYREDRAEIFADLMTRTYLLNGQYISGSPMRAKADILISNLDNYFSTVRNTSPTWKRLLR